jgi:hypothetical protein
MLIIHIHTLIKGMIDITTDVIEIETGIAGEPQTLVMFSIIFHKNINF